MDTTAESNNLIELAEAFKRTGNRRLTLRQDVQMETKYIIKQNQIISTNTKPCLFKFMLEAEGAYKEIEWYKKQINKIGEHPNKTLDSDGKLHRRSASTL